MPIAPIARLLVPGLLLLSILANAAGGARGQVLYRYTDNQGILVLNESVPPEYVAGGYEILSHSGRVLEVVPPQLSPEEYEVQRQQEVQKEADRKLLKRYNSVADIESARKRKLAIVEQDMAIMRSNINSLGLQIAQEEASAARTQRGGREVAPELLQRIADLQKEVSVLRERLSRRADEAVSINDEFDKAAARYAELMAKH
ncbi:hypothetical protein Misp06_02034 [Microbulbifer sp. NBRC 101763]|uniref:hypothetical protein n=1 Tax=Microbulbifer TaxID=48073 RepID=UPI0003654275|nr:MULTISPECIES: hypothetical protein [Microbulbifer]WHI51333.1 hypothetical protein P3339_00365 [Microbulbifer sp. MLAF003]